MTSPPEAASVVGALHDENVQFVVVGEPVDGEPLVLVVSRHPTNLEALGRALDRLGSAIRDDVGGAPGHDDGPRRVVDAAGTIPVTTPVGDVDFVFGGPRRSLYAEVLAGAQERAIGGVRVQWAVALPFLQPARRTTNRLLGRRLLSLAEGLLRLEEREERETELLAGGGAPVEDTAVEDPGPPDAEA